MLSNHEVLSTLEMIKSENLDLRTVTLGISLFDCASDDPERFKDRVYRKIVSLAADLVDTCDEIGEKIRCPGGQQADFR